MAPVELHLLSLKTPRQTSASYKVVILQEDSNWRQTGAEQKGEDPIKQSTIMQKLREAAAARFRSYPLST